MPRPVRRKLVAASVVVLALALAGAALAGNGGIAPQPARSPNADRIRDSYWLLLGITGGIFVLVEGALVVFVIRFRGRGRPRDVEGPEIRGHTRLELIWTAIPVLILAVIASFVFYKLPGIKDVPSATAGGGRLEVKVEGHQFYWEFVYPNGVVQVNRLRAPAGRVVRLSITTPDVDHSWWIPSLGGKFDAIPGRVNHTWFRVSRPGSYEGQCGEFCGVQHQAMRAVVDVVPPGEFDRWLTAEAAAQGAGTSRLGAITFSGACATCHGFRGQGYIGPAINNNPLLRDRRGMTTLLRRGRGKMPAVGATLDDRQLNATITYLRKRFAQGT
jgi:cytochrome c oxidase subunit II